MPHDHDHEYGVALVRLLDNGRLDEVLSRVSLTEIADAWRCCHERAAADEHLDATIRTGGRCSFGCRTARVRWLEETARRSARFRQAPASVWIWGYEAEWVCERLERAAGVPLARLER